MYVNEAEILVATADRVKASNELAVRLLSTNTSLSCIDCLASEQILIAENQWDINDVAGLDLIRWVVASEPKIPTIAFIKPDCRHQETSARGFGASIVLPDDINYNCFYEILCQLLSAQRIVSIKAAADYVADIDKPKQQRTHFSHIKTLSSSLLGLKSIYSKLSHTQQKISKTLSGYC